MTNCLSVWMENNICSTLHYNKNVL